MFGKGIGYYLMFRVFVRSNGKVLEIFSRDNCIILNIELVLQNGNVKM